MPLTGQISQENSRSAVWDKPPHCFEVHFGLNGEQREQLRPEMAKLLHETFIRHPDYDAEHLPEFMDSDIYIRILNQGRLAGIFTADILCTQGHPFLHLSTGFVALGARSGGLLLNLSMGLVLDLASQAYGTDHFFVGLRTANPRVIAKLWQNPWVRYYPRLDDMEGDPLLAELRPHFCAHAFGADRCGLKGIIFYDIYPTPPWEGKIPWHHDQRINVFCREHLRPQGLDAFLFLGPTTPPFTGLERGAVTYPGPFKPV